MLNCSGDHVSRCHPRCTGGWPWQDAFSRLTRGCYTIEGIYLLSPAAVRHIRPIVFVKARGIFEPLFVHIEHIMIPIPRLLPCHWFQRSPGNGKVLLTHSQEATKA